MKLRLGTRGSPLALAQSNWVAQRLSECHRDLQIDLSVIRTQGDNSQATDTPLSSYSEKGVFAKEIEQALIAGEIDLAVHSAKDLAAQLPEGLQIGAVPVREDPRDAVVGCPLALLQPGDVVGTGSARRGAILRKLFPRLEVRNIRGNVSSRIAKLRSGDYKAIILAVAGLNRLGLADEIDEKLDPAVFVPDPGQGCLAVQSRVDDGRTNTLLACVNDVGSYRCLMAERAFLRRLGGGCQTPVGALARYEAAEGMRMSALLASANQGLCRATLSGPARYPEDLGERAADHLLQMARGENVLPS